MTSSILFFCIILIILIEFIFGKVIDHLNNKSWSEKLPVELHDFYDEQKYQEARNYHQAGEKLGFWSGAISICLSLGLIIFDEFYWIYEQAFSYIDHNIGTPLLFFAILGLGSFIIGIPFSYYRNFVIEEKFGFNKMNIRTFILDNIKGLALSSIIGGGLLYLFILFYIQFPVNFWLYAWAAFTAFSLFMAAFYVDLIVPLFNKLSPLEDEVLMEKIKILAEKTNFPLNSIMVIDGSKRSSKANAYFSGIGGKKSIVLFDTLLDDHSHEELLAILAHEIGHYKKKHILYSFSVSSLNMFISLFILSWFINSPELSQALGAPDVNFAIGLIAFGLIYSPVSTLTSIFMNYMSRKFEYQADHFANIHTQANDLISALKKLSVKNLSNLTPHPSFVFIHYSHPTLLQRIKALKEII